MQNYSEEDQKEVLQIMEDTLETARRELEALQFREKFIKGLDDTKFKSNEPKRHFEIDPNWVISEKELTLVSIEKQILRVKGEIIGQKDLIKKTHEEIKQDKKNKEELEKNANKKNNKNTKSKK